MLHKSPVKETLFQVFDIHCFQRQHPKLSKKNIGCTTPAAELDENELTVKLLSACPKKIMVDKAASI